MEQSTRHGLGAIKKLFGVASLPASLLHPENIAHVAGIIHHLVNLSKPAAHHAAKGLAAMAHGGQVQPILDAVLNLANQFGPTHAYDQAYAGQLIGGGTTSDLLRRVARAARRAVSAVSAIAPHVMAAAPHIAAAVPHIGEIVRGMRSGGAHETLGDAIRNGGAVEPRRARDRASAGAVAPNQVRAARRPRARAGGSWIDDISGAVSAMAPFAPLIYGAGAPMGGMIGGAPVGGRRLIGGPGGLRRANAGGSWIDDISGAVSAMAPFAPLIYGAGAPVGGRRLIGGPGGVRRRPSAAQQLARLNIH